MSNDNSFAVGMDFRHVHKTISEHVYETPLAFLRENVQNALDAIRIQAHGSGTDASNPEFTIEIEVSPTECSIRDNGIGMSRDDLKKYFWTIGASGKRTDAARAAGCVGMFGIGGFANFGICNELTVISRREGELSGTLTRLTEQEIEEATTDLPRVHSEPSTLADPRGTIVSGQFKSPVNVVDLKRYIVDFVRFASEKVTFNEDGVISQAEYFADVANDDLVSLTDADSTWSIGGVELTGQLFRTANHAVVVARLTGLKVSGEVIRFQALLRMENGAIDVLKRGFKLCSTAVQTPIGISGRIDCDRMSPTAGRDSLNTQSQTLVQQIANAVQYKAVELILQSREMLAQHARIYRYATKNGWVGKLGNAEVQMADGSSSTLGAIQQSSKRGVGVFFGTHQKTALSQIMQARGNLVVLLPNDNARRNAVQSFLSSFCNAKPFSGIVEFQEVYQDLDRFERIFLSELELTIQSEFDIRNVKFTVGNLTEDIPVYLTEKRSSGPLEIAVDVRHPEISKLRKLDFGPLLYSLIGTFCREYLGPALRKKSPKFFGSGAMNLDLLEKKRSELWVLVKQDIHTVSRTSKRQVVRSSDIQTITAGGRSGSVADSNEAADNPLVRHPKLLLIRGDKEFSDILGYYIRIPDPAAKAFGDVIKQYENRGVVWAGNKVLFVASDGVSSAFQFEIRLEHVIVTSADTGQSVEGAEQFQRSLQEVNEGLYFPLPHALESSLVPAGTEEIRIEVSSGDWIDTRNSHAWRANDES